MNQRDAQNRTGEAGRSLGASWTLVIDVVAVLVFVAIGLSAHGHTEDVANLASVAAPFLVGVAVGHLLLKLRGACPDVINSGVVVVLATIAVGQVLRVVFGQGTAISFIAVSLVFNSLTMIGWRAGLAMLRKGALSSRNS